MIVGPDDDLTAVAAPDGVGADVGSWTMVWWSAQVALTLQPPPMFTVPPPLRPEASIEASTTAMRSPVTWMTPPCRRPFSVAGVEFAGDAYVAAPPWTSMFEA